MTRDPRFDRQVEMAAIAGSGIWTLATLLCFANGNFRAGYALGAIGVVVGTSLALIRVGTEPAAALELREEIGTAP